jgi:pantoate--beta-alanine ligase
LVILKIVTRIADLEHPAGLTTGLVPTMGGFHDGHLQLMRTARTECDRVVVSLFVNPTQFGAGEDYERYPRDRERDAGLAEQAGVDILFAPGVDDIYPRPGTSIHVPMVTTLWEGAIRPVHFAGVATVVCKLFNIVRPEIAYFGLKDLQQCLVISRMVEDLNIPVRISLQPTVREADGLALSSRNAYLTEEERQLAPLLYDRLSACNELLRSDGLSHDEVGEALRHARTALEDAGFRVDYFELIDLETTHLVRSHAKPCALIAAARLGKTRLIDNILVSNIGK